MAIELLVSGHNSNYSWRALLGAETNRPHM